MSKYLLIPIVLVLCLSLKPKAQEPDLLLKEARQLELAFREIDALQKYLQVLTLQPTHILALCKTSELYNLIGRRIQDKEKQRSYYQASQQYAEKALRVNPNSSEANFVMALAMGRMAQTGSGQQRINAVKLIRQYAERCVQLDPNNFKGYHVLGKWNLEVSNLNSIEKWLVKVAFGALPKASVEDAITNYEKSRKLNPSFQLNYLELARCYNKVDQKEKARQQIRTLLAMPAVSVDDQRVHKEARDLQADLQ